MEHINTDSVHRFIDDSLPQGELVDFERHLLQCNSCRVQLSTVIRLIGKELSEEDGAVLDQIDAKLPPPRSGTWKVRSELRSHRLVRLAAAIAACLVLLAGLGWLLRFERGHAPSRDIASVERPFEGRLAGSDSDYARFSETRSTTLAVPETRAEDEPRNRNLTEYETGRLYLLHRNYPSAVKHLEMAEKSQPSSAEIRNDLAVAYMESAEDGNMEKALGELRAALELNAHFTPAIFNLALTYERLGYFPEAEQQLRLYLQTDPNSEWANEVKSKLRAWQR